MTRTSWCFFSVPYDDGFSATVNGEPAAIEKVDDGLMAVYVPAGENEIEFTYHTPGLKVSACVSAAAIAVYGVYLLGIIKRKSQPGSSGNICRGRRPRRPAGGVKTPPYESI